MAKVLIGQLLDKVPSKAQVLQFSRQASRADFSQQIIPQVKVPEGIGQGVGVQLGDEVAGHGELADPVVRGHVVDGGQLRKVQARHLGE